MTFDHILEILFDSGDALTEETVEGTLFLTACAGSVLTAPGAIDAYFVSSEERDSAAEVLSSVAVVRLVKSDREQIDWLDRYQQSLEPLFIGERFVIAPDASLIAGARLALVIPQEQAFGTGSHETTALCIELLETIAVRGSGLDIGSGSGILALAMIRLGAERVIAFDNDLDAYAALRENRSRNAVDPATMPIFIGGTDALRGGGFEFITMNILPDVIIALLKNVVSHLAAGGALVLSGILTSRRDDVVQAAGTQGLTLKDERERGEWWAGVFYRRDSIGT